MSVECFCLTKRYGRKLALEDVSLEINDGGVTGLIGPNGAGKSTLIKLITGLIWPTEGFVLVDGYDAHREHVKAMRRIGAIIEWPSFIPDLSAGMNLDIFSGGHGKQYRAKRDEILRFMELNTVLDRKVGSFSTGMWKIAKMHNIKLDVLLALNQMSREQAAKIIVGQEIIVPAEQGK